ncbi:MAG: polysaccharide biosynthesis protein [Firmicutes bacterium]|nr:polysaccharide biosynthesis protein [Alicyclobacillaceae bacterium]MCL6497206.1 polysaccharide biosynthesis protein [Bacillota bacterium]
MPRQSVWQGAVWLSLGSLVSKGLGAVYRIFLPRVLGDYGVGLFQIAYPLYAVLLAVSVNGIPTALAKEVAERQARRDLVGAQQVVLWALTGLAALGLVLAAAMALAAPWVADTLFGEPAAAGPIRALAPALALVALEAGLRGSFQGEASMRPTAVSQILEQVVRVAVMFPLALWLMPRGVPAAVTGASLGASVGAVAGFAYLARERWRHWGPSGLPRRPVPWSGLKRLAAVAAPMSMAGLFFPLTMLADSMVVPHRLRHLGLGLTEATANFGRLSGEAMPLINLTLVVGAALAVSLVPAVAQAISSGRQAEAADRVANAVRLIWACGLPMSGGLFFLARPLTATLYGEAGAAAVLRILSLGAPVLALQQVFGASLQAAGRGWAPVRNLLWGTGVKYGLTWWLTGIAGLGIEGAAVGTVVASAVVTYLNWQAWCRAVPPAARTSLWRHLGVPLGATAVMGMGLTLLHRLVGPLSAPLWTAMALPAGALVYVAGLLASGEARELLNLVRQR